MSEWAARRFWKTAEARAQDGGFGIFLDERQVKTPGKRGLILPTEAMAARVVAEWDAQDGKINPATMPWTKSANSAIDKMAEQRREVEDHLIGYAGTDLVSYRAEGPDQLIRRQAEAWDPVLAWADAAFGGRLRVTTGVMPVAQDHDSIARLKGQMATMTDFHLTGFHDLVTLSGSYLLALAATALWKPSTEVWSLSRVDERWQIEQWGRDEEAESLAENKERAFLHAAEFFHSA
jgi:chaperone required for assembly of F1-ATPase